MQKEKDKLDEYKHIHVAEVSISEVLGFANQVNFLT